MLKALKRWMEAGQDAPDSPSVVAAQQELLPIASWRATAPGPDESPRETAMTENRSDASRNTRRRILHRRRRSLRHGPSHRA